MRKSLFIFVLIFSFFNSQSQTSGGPDAYGYTWKNSNHSSNPPVYSWVDITTRGVQVTGLADDNVVGPFTLPAGFQYYWYPISQYWIGSNGYLSLNGTNIASPFPASIPTSGGANDWIAAHLSDLKFDGVGNPAKCYSYTNNDTLIITYENVPYWTLASPGYSGSNTFQIIISSIDKSITFNYKSMASGVTTIPIDNAVGIENNTGALGLQTMIDVVPGSAFTIKYYYPTTVTYSVTDGGINWNNNSNNYGYFIPKANVFIPLKANVKNFGNQPISNFTVTDSILLGSSTLSSGAASISSLQPGADTTISFSNSFVSQFTGTYTFISNVQGITGDLVPVNNRQSQKIISVDVSPPTYKLDYSNGAAGTATISWGGGNGGVAVYIEPPVYPVKINSSQFHIGVNAVVPVGFSAMIYDDNGPGGTAGTLLDSVFVQPNSVIVGQYNSVVPQNNNIVISSGGVYLVWYMGGPDIGISTDATLPSSRRSFEILGNAWAGYRDRLNQDFLMGITVSNAPSAPVADFVIDSSQAPVISFFDISTKSPNKWHWDFDYNGDTSNVKTPTYTYVANGTYNVCLIATNSVGSDTVCKTFTIHNITGVGISEDEFEDLLFYPNPTVEVGFIDVPNGKTVSKLEVYNLNGEKIMVPYHVNSQKIVVKTASLSSGVYIFKLNFLGNTNPVRGRFIVK